MANNNNAGKFKVNFNKCLLKGNFGNVYACNDDGGGGDDDDDFTRTVVSLDGKKKNARELWAKVINKDTIAKSTFDKYCRREVVLLGEVRTQSQSVLQLVGSFEVNNYYFIITESCGGTSLLDSVVKLEKQYSETEVKRMIKTIAECLSCLHEGKIVFRDLRADNVYFKHSQGVENELKLVDFSLATHIPFSDGGCGTLCGDQLYVAPEMLHGLLYDFSADIWALGILTYILICGYPPYFNSNKKELFKAIKFGKFQFDNPYWEKPSPQVKDLITQCLEKQPGKRITIKQVLLHPWFTLPLTSAAVENNTNPSSYVKIYQAKRKFNMALARYVAAAKTFNKPPIPLTAVEHVTKKEPSLLIIPGLVILSVVVIALVIALK